MYIKKLKLTDFRNYDSLELDVSPGVNVIYGKNGQGKTNILEAMFLCSIGKSFRTSHDIEMIKNDKKSFLIEINIGDNLYGSVSVKYDNKKSKIICVDGACIPKMRFLMGKLVGVMFSPEDMRLISDGPSQRRKFIDMAICQLSSIYYHALLMYNKTVKEKNILLSAHDVGKIDKIFLSAYNDALAEYGSLIIFERIKFIKSLAVYAEESHRFITDKNENIKINYIPSFAAVFSDKDIKENTVKKNIRELLCSELNSEKNVCRETERRKCLIGPHRDDFDIVINNVNLKQYGSQGQKRTAVIAIKLAELSIMREITGRTPVLFLDDVMSELDGMRKKKLVECLGGVQTFITCTDKDIAGDFENEGSAVNYINAEILR